MEQTDVQVIYTGTPCRLEVDRRLVPPFVRRDNLPGVVTPHLGGTAAGGRAGRRKTEPTASGLLFCVRARRVGGNLNGCFPVIFRR